MSLTPAPTLQTRAWTTRKILAATLAASLMPFVTVEVFRPWFYHVVHPTLFLVFHNISEFFSVMVSLSIFGVGWFTYHQSKNRHILFLSSAFLAIGLMDFMHTLAYAGMPDFVTPNSANKSSQFWIAVRLFASLAFVVSAFIDPGQPRRWLSRRVLTSSALAISAGVFAAITLFPSHIPVAYLEGSGLTLFKKASEFVIVSLLAAAFIAYWKRRADDRELNYYLAAFVLCIFGELSFTIYRSVYDTFNVLGHIYKVAAFILIYKGVFATSVNNPYVMLAETNETLRQEIIEHKRAQAELDKHREHLEELVQQRTEALASSNRDLEQFGYVVSHDLQEPLRAVTGFLQLLEIRFAGELNDKARGYINQATEGARRMSQMIQDLLELSRVQRSTRESVPTDMNAVFQQALANCSASIRDTGAEVTSEELPTVPGDPNQLIQLLQNLIGNGVKFRRPGERPKIHLSALRREEYWVFRIRDNGIGIPADQADKVFQPFHRLHSRDEIPGTGVGLAICKKIVERHGGEIWIEPPEGEGTAICFAFPETGASRSKSGPPPDAVSQIQAGR